MAWLSYNAARWIRQSNRVYYERRWNEDEGREERRRTETIVCFKECRTADTFTAEFNSIFNVRELPKFTVYYSGNGGNSYSDTYEAFNIDDVDVYDNQNEMSRITISGSITDQNWWYKDGDTWVEITGEE